MMIVNDYEFVFRRQENMTLFPSLHLSFSVSFSFLYTHLVKEFDRLIHTKMSMAVCNPSQEYLPF